MGLYFVSNQSISHNKFLRLITNSYHYVTNQELHDDLEIKWVYEVIQDFATKHERRLLRHPNVEAIQIRDNL